jgi:1-deoxy-D-xylulose-5-phosphate reductoisomerase
VSTKRIAILGSTGSIGRQALEVIAAQDDLEACALAAGGNWKQLTEQVAQTGAKHVAIADESAADELSAALGEGPELLTGPDAMTELVRRSKPDILLVAVVGAAGLAPTLAGIDCGAALALANKEALVMAGGLVMPAARAAGVDILPVDSEHSAIYQCLHSGRREEVRRVTITASGGALRDWDAKTAAEATVDDALNHPTWSMGRKITIDSATMMNKALEIVEAHWLFDLPADEINVVLHAQSVIHAMVDFADGSAIAQMGLPDMTTPIAYALNWPDRRGRPVAPLDLAALGQLTFRRLEGRFADAVELGYEAIRRGGLAGAVLNAANEAAVEAFLEHRIRFGHIVPLVARALADCPPVEELSLEALLEADAWARQEVILNIDRGITV